VLGGTRTVGGAASTFSDPDEPGPTPFQAAHGSVPGNVTPELVRRYSIFQESVRNAASTHEAIAFQFSASSGKHPRGKMFLTVPLEMLGIARAQERNGPRT